MHTRRGPNRRSCSTAHSVAFHADAMQMQSIPHSRPFASIVDPFLSFPLWLNPEQRKRLIPQFDMHTFFY